MAGASEYAQDYDAAAVLDVSLITAVCTTRQGLEAGS